MYIIPAVALQAASGCWYAISPNLPAGLCRGDTEEDVKGQLRAAAATFITDCLCDGIPIPAGITEHTEGTEERPCSLIVQVVVSDSKPKAKKLLDAPLVSTFAVAWLAGSTAHEIVAPQTTRWFLAVGAAVVGFLVVLLLARYLVSMSKKERGALLILASGSLFLAVPFAWNDCRHSIPLALGASVTERDSNAWTVRFEIDSYLGASGRTDCVTLSLPDDGRQCRWTRQVAVDSGAGCISVTPEFPIELDLPQTVVNVHVRAEGEMCHAEVTLRSRCRSNVEVPAVERSGCDPLARAPWAEGR